MVGCLRLRFLENEFVAFHTLGPGGPVRHSPPGGWERGKLQLCNK